MLDDPSLNVRNYSFSQYSRCPCSTYTGRLGDSCWKTPVKGVPDWYMNVPDSDLNRRVVAVAPTQL